MNRILLLGAGFSRNWGGWLAMEAFEYLLGCQQIDAGLRDLLWKHKQHGGFETALAELQKVRIGQNAGRPDQRLTNLQDGIRQMFGDMNESFSRIVDFEFQTDKEHHVRPFLAKFDAIFTLNQDLLLEHHSLNPQNYNISLLLPRRWNNCYIPGMKRHAAVGSGIDPPNPEFWTPDEGGLELNPRSQPYFKLHGSSNWFDSDSRELLVMGGEKASFIDHHPVLKWYHEQFREYLSRPDTRLMVIGYSFGDDHVNNAICDAVAGGGLDIFIIDLLGVDVIDENRDATIYTPGQLASALQPHLIGASRRRLREIFGGDRVEHGKVMKFFS